MNEILNCIKTRRSIRSFQPKQISPDLLEDVITAGTYAASGHGQQAAQIVAIQNPEIIARLSAMNAAVMGVKSDPYYGAPTLLLVFADSEIATYIQDGCCVLNNMMIAAHAIGLGTCWINREEQMFDSAEGKALIKEWGLKETMKGVGALSIGYPDKPALAAKPRKSDYCIYIR